MTSIPPDMSPTPEELLAEVHRLVHQVVRLARAEHGRIPGVGTSDWWTAPTSARFAAILILGQAWLVHDPERAIDDRFKAMSVDLSGALGWAAAARQPQYSELAARRAVPVTPVRCQHAGCRAVLSVPHPLPDLRTVRCASHREPERMGEVA